MLLELVPTWRISKQHLVLEKDKHAVGIEPERDEGREKETEKEFCSHLSCQGRAYHSLTKRGLERHKTSRMAHMAQP